MQAEATFGDWQVFWQRNNTMPGKDGGFTEDELNAYLDTSAENKRKAAQMVRESLDDPKKMRALVQSGTLASIKPNRKMRRARRKVMKDV